jgi:hypothetical protein
MWPVGAPTHNARHGILPLGHRRGSARETGTCDVARPAISHGREERCAVRMLGVPPWNAEQAEWWRARGHDPAGDAPKDVPLPLKRAIRRMGADSDTRLKRHVWCHSARVTGMACAGPSAREPTRSTWADATRLSGPAQAEIQHADVCLRNPRAGCDYSGSPRAARGMTLGREPNRAWITPAEHPSKRMCPRKCRRGHVDTPAYRARG